MISNSRRLHLEYLLFPPSFGIAREVELSHDRKPWLTVERQILVVQSDGSTGWREAMLPPLKSEGCGGGEGWRASISITFEAATKPEGAACAGANTDQKKATSAQ